MTRLTFLFHSGFAVETDSLVLLFDYWMDPSMALPGILASGKPLYVLASHFHQDHFSPEVLRLRKPGRDVTLILSKDILRHRMASRMDADVWLGKGGVWRDDRIRVTATGSTDSGVSWVVEADGLRLFHAGDLNNWYARFLETENPDGLVRTDEGLMVDPLKEEKRFLGELKEIRRLFGGFDVVMFPVDARIGNGYLRGARQMLGRFSIGLMVPMHFTMGGFESAWRLREYCQERSVPFWEIGMEGESVLLDDFLLMAGPEERSDNPGISEAAPFHS